MRVVVVMTDPTSGELPSATVSLAEEVSLSSTSEVEGMVAGSSEKKKEVVGVGERARLLSDSRLEGLMVSGLISFTSLGFLAK